MEATEGRRGSNQTFAENYAKRVSRDTRWAETRNYVKLSRDVNFIINGKPLHLKVKILSSAASAINTFYCNRTITWLFRRDFGDSFFNITPVA